jgi:hypothetical protein
MMCDNPTIYYMIIMIFKLRDLGSVLNFAVDYDETAKTVLITSASSLADAA